MKFYSWERCARHILYETRKSIASEWNLKTLKKKLVLKSSQISKADQINSILLNLAGGGVASGKRSAFSKYKRTLTQILEPSNSSKCHWTEDVKANTFKPIRSLKRHPWKMLRDAEHQEEGASPGRNSRCKGQPWSWESLGVLKEQVKKAEAECWGRGWWQWS